MPNEISSKGRKQYGLCVSSLAPSFPSMPNGGNMAFMFILTNIEGKIGREYLLLKFYCVIKTLLGEQKVIYSPRRTQFRRSTRIHNHNSRQGAV